MGKITFSKNEIPYGQDFCFCRGIPEDVEFVWELLGDRNRIRLTARGYGMLGSGGNLYGRGPLYVSIQHLSPAVRKEAGLPESLPMILFTEFSDIVEKVLPIEIDAFIADLRDWYLAAYEGRADSKGFSWSNDGKVGNGDEPRAKIQ